MPSELLPDQKITDAYKRYAALPPAVSRGFLNFTEYLDFDLRLGGSGIEAQPAAPAAAPSAPAGSSPCANRPRKAARRPSAATSASSPVAGMTRLEIARKSLAFDAQQPKVRRLEARLEARQARVAKANEREQRAKEYAIAVARREANGMSRQAAHVEAMARVPKNYEAWKGADCPPIQGARGAKGYVTRVAELQVEGFSQSEARARARSENPKGFRAHEASLSTA